MSSADLRITIIMCTFIIAVAAVMIVRARYRGRRW